MVVDVREMSKGGTLMVVDMREMSKGGTLMVVEVTIKPHRCAQEVLGCVVLSRTNVAWKKVWGGWGE